MKIFRRNFIKTFFLSLPVLFLMKFDLLSFRYLWHIKYTNFYIKELQNCMKKKKKIFLVSFTGFNKNKLSKITNYSFIVNSKNYNIIENVHSVWFLMIIDRLSRKLIL